MLDGSSIENITSDASLEAGTVMVIGDLANTVPVDEGKPTFYMEGGKIFGSDIPVASWKRTWVSAIVITRYGRMYMSGGEIKNNWTIERRATAAQRARGDVIPGKQVMGGDVFLNAASTHATQPRAENAPYFEISGTAEVEFLFLAGNPLSFTPNSPTVPSDARPHLFSIGKNWTGKIINLIPDSDGIPCMNGWLDEQFVGAGEGHTLSGADIDKIEKIMFYPSVDDNGVVQQDMEPRRDRAISNSGNNIGTWLAVDID